jgi:two-component system, OmpR family, sensor kinase
VKLLRFLFPFLLVAAGLALDLSWEYFNGPKPIVFLRVDVGTLLLITGILAGLITWYGLLIWGLAARQGALALRREQLAAAESHRRFIRRLDHEIKNPLTAIRAGLANLNSANDGTVVRSVRTQVDRLARLTADLRKLADLESQPIEREKVDLGELLNEVVEQVNEREERLTRQVRLSVPSAPWPPTPVPGDRDLLFLALHNLVDNALKYSRAGDTIELRAFEDGASEVVEVADTGAGIPENELPQVWDELYRGQGARGVPGSGLGLALVRAIVERHGGSVDVRSRTGQGTVFAVRLPLR